MKLLRFSMLLLPAAFVGLTIAYKDSFYIFLALGSLPFSVLVVFPSLLDKRIVLKNFKLTNSLIKGEKKVIENLVEDLEKEKNIYNPRYLIGILFLLFTFLFSYIAVLKLTVAPNGQNIFIEYYQNQLSFFKSFFHYLLIGALLVVYILSIVLLKHKKR